ncbi:MAG: peptide chain release factor N(5)-glutamine methyltransferase [candidate division Zixibacteria bacterium]|nr:peptide chain release factor N(5)-glutamine methyltransferase [candidate division Zixibacteria bacterium]MDD5427551.1 peptide chain release factor N(5)-glutamine methyltransferase [candidate division Zixibacteria bacterium]
MENLSKFISQKAALLEKVGIDQAKAEIELILCHLLEVDRLKMYLDGAKLLSDTVIARFDKILEKRLTRYPLQYILGEAWFYGRKFFISEAVMVPTPETELLCELAINFIRKRSLARSRILDIGVGSGVISVTLVGELEQATVLAVDISETALEVARYNATSLGGLDRIEFRLSNMFEAVGKDEKFDLIVSNPPYITEEDYKILPPEVLADPKIALVAGEKGLDVIEELLRQAPDFLNDNGRLMFEIGYNQALWVVELTEKDKRYRSIDIVKDLNRVDRVIILSCKDA